MADSGIAHSAIAHWDEARSWRGEKGHIAGTWHSLTGSRSRTVGVKRIQVDPGMWSTPLHLEGAVCIVARPASPQTPTITQIKRYPLSDYALARTPNPTEQS